MEDRESVNMLMIGLIVMAVMFLVIIGVLFLRINELSARISDLKSDMEIGDEALHRRINDSNEDLMAVQISIPELWSDISEVKSIVRNTNKALTRTNRQIKDDPIQKEAATEEPQISTKKEQTMHEVFPEEETEAINNAVEVDDAPEGPEGMTYLGYYELTAYEATGSPCADGTWPVEWSTVACNSIPLGTTIYIEGYGTFTVHDTGGMGGNVIDIYLGDPAACVQFGRQGANVYIVN